MRPCESASLCETEIGKHGDMRVRQTISFSLSPSATHTLTHIISIISPSGELLANNRLVRPLLTLCLQCETKTNYIRCCVKQLQSFHRCRDQGLTKGSPLMHDKCDPLIFCKAVMTGTSQEKVATWLFVLGRLLVGSR